MPSASVTVVVATTLVSDARSNTVSARYPADTVSRTSRPRPAIATAPGTPPPEPAAAISRSSIAGRQQRGADGGRCQGTNRAGRQGEPVPDQLRLEHAAHARDGHRPVETAKRRSGERDQVIRGFEQDLPRLRVGFRQGGDNRREDGEQ